MQLKSRYLFLFILLLAAVLRLYHLGSNPPSLDWDEASLGYNAYSLLKTGRDEYGNLFPLSIRSFNDYKPPLYSYLTIPSIAVFGLTDFAVRLPSAIAGILAVVAIYFLAREISSSDKSNSTVSPHFPLFSMFILTISPWHLQFSRPAFEANLALTCYLLALTFFLKWINHSKNLQFGFWNLLFAATAAVAALYSYHSARLVVPLTFLILAIFYHRPLLARYRQTLLAAGLALILIAPLIIIFVRGSAAERFNTVSIFTNPGEFSRERERITRTADFKASHPNPLSYFHTSKAVYAKIIARNYFEHFNFDFLFLRADGNPRHHASGMGLLYLIEFPFLIYGAYSLTRRRERHKAVVWTILFTGPAASALTASTPHAIRSLLMLPALILLTSYGSTQAINKLGHLEIWSIRNSLLVACSLFLVFMNIFYYLNLYYVVTPYQFSQDWQYGYRQLVTKVGEYQPNYNHVIITTKYDQPYIYFAFYNRLDPDYYQSISQTASDHIGNITFHPITESDFDSPNALIAADQATTPANAHILDQIYFLNGQVAFNLISTN